MTPRKDPAVLSLTAKERGLLAAMHNMARDVKDPRHGWFSAAEIRSSQYGATYTTNQAISTIAGHLARKGLVQTQAAAPDDAVRADTQRRCRGGRG